MKIRKLDLEFADFAFLLLGIALLVLAGSVVLAVRGHENLYVKIMIGVGVIFVIAGFLIGNIPGCGGAIVVFAIIVLLIDWLPVPLAILLAIAGVASIVFWFKDFFEFEKPKKY